MPIIIILYAIYEQFLEYNKSRNKLLIHATNTLHKKLKNMNNNNNGSVYLVLGLMFTTLGLTILDDNKTLQYGALILGVLLTIYSVLVFDKKKKSQKNLKDKND